MKRNRNNMLELQKAFSEGMTLYSLGETEDEAIERQKLYYIGGFISLDELEFRVTDIMKRMKRRTRFT